MNLTIILFSIVGISTIFHFHKSKMLFLSNFSNTPPISIYVTAVQNRLFFLSFHILNAEYDKRMGFVFSNILFYYLPSRKVHLQSWFLAKVRCFRVVLFFFVTVIGDFFDTNDDNKFLHVYVRLLFINSIILDTKATLDIFFSASE